MNPVFFLLPFIIAATCSFFAKTERFIYLSSVFFTVFGSTLLILYSVPFVLHAQVRWVNAWWMIDGFSGLIVLLITFVYMTSLVVSVRYIGHEFTEKIVSLKQVKIYFTLFHLFVACMIVTVLTNNLLILWLALEGTTLFSTFLVGLYLKKTSIEAAWKYMILCSTGISLGLVGLLLLSYGAHVGGLHGGDIFLIRSLIENAHIIPENIIKLSFVFIFIGFGTKVGLVPMHTWLPDAHSKAPSPISAIFSAVLLNVALYAIVRFKYVADAGLVDSTWTNHLFLIFGALSIFLSAFMILIQSNYKRMLAYSSIEHMGLILFAFGLSPLAAAAGVMHMIGHTFAKSALFFGAGEILIAFKTTKIPKVTNMSIRLKYTSALFVCGIIMILAIPPSALFVSEFGLFAQAITFYPKTAICMLVALSVIAYGMLSLTINMIFCKKDDCQNKGRREKWQITHTIMAVEFVIIIAMAFWFTTDRGVHVINAIVHDFLYIT